MKKEQYDLVAVLHSIFVENQPVKIVVETYNELLKQTGLTKDEFHELACQKQTLGNLKYRILGLMAKKKIDFSHII
jgi:hypothetical protein